MTPLQREALQMCLEYIETDAHERRHVRWKINEALEEQPAPVQQEQVCPQKICWTPYDCENGRCTGSEKNEPVGRFNGKFRAGDGKMFFEVEVEHDKALPAVFSAIYTSPQPAQRSPLTPEQKRNLWYSTSVTAFTPDACYYQGLLDAEQFHNIKGDA